jgi:hypothetical protein
MTDAIYFPLLETCDGMGRNLDGAIPDGRVAHLNEVLGAALECISDVAAEAALGDNQWLASC